MACIVKLSVFLIPLLLCYCTAKELPTVKIWQGQLQGKVDVSLNNQEYYSFLGIPYAKPPVDDLRFQPPKPAEKWKGTLNAVKPGAECIQFSSVDGPNANDETSEDCLFLNVYTKKPPSTHDLSKPAPVLVWIHGGGLQFGSGDPKLYAPDYLIDQDVVLVTVNYRVGLLGFLNVGHKLASGNMGLKDQVMALKWIQKNIGAFGGDPNKVTLFGESGGGAAVHNHMLSPMSKGLFHSAICQSGTANAPWGFLETRYIPKKLEIISENTKCSLNNREEFIKCLKNIPALDLVNINFGAAPTDMVFGFTPTVEFEGDEKFLLDEPVKLMKRGQFNDVPLLIGFNKDEGAYFYGLQLLSGSFFENLNKDFESTIPGALFIDGTFDTDKELHEFTRKVRQFYFKDGEISEKDKQKLVDMYSDRLFIYPTYATVKLQKEKSKSPIYLYELNHRGTVSLTDVLKMDDLGVSHFDDIQYLFKCGMFSTHLHDLKEDHDDRKVSKLMTTMWAEFARTGNPTPEDNNDLSFRWDPITKNSEIRYLKINPNPSMVKGVPSKERMNFWEKTPVPEAGWEPQQLDRDEL